MRKKSMKRHQTKKKIRNDSTRHNTEAKKRMREEKLEIFWAGTSSKLNYYSIADSFSRFILDSMFVVAVIICTRLLLLWLMKRIDVGAGKDLKILSLVDDYLVWWNHFCLLNSKSFAHTILLLCCFPSLLLFYSVLFYFLTFSFLSTRTHQPAADEDEIIFEYFDFFLAIFHYFFFFGKTMQQSSQSFNFPVLSTELKIHLFL